ncbi:hypothetical protein [Pectobacterium brasiliense]|uniref:hypothetical protein n=1 Tax=Pectobacterium brasiliense TaxID=180957 RepID=UPI0019697E33|nr:hypothetical protein [Pectobacterium brasiliense]MBN3262990.1 hypothetical protein [Pectobacterium brasiliense]
MRKISFAYAGQSVVVGIHSERGKTINYSVTIDGVSYRQPAYGDYWERLFTPRKGKRDWGEAGSHYRRVVSTNILVTLNAIIQRVEETDITLDW